MNAGQLCIAPDYALVHKDVKDEFLELAVSEIQKAHFSEENNNLVQIINERNFDRVINLIDPNKMYYGGTHNRKDRRIYPTIMYNVTLDDAVMQEEIFGPILPVIEYETIDEAFEIIKSIEKPLAAYLFSDSTVN